MADFSIAVLMTAEQAVWVEKVASLVEAIITSADEDELDYTLRVSAPSSVSEEFREVIDRLSPEGFCAYVVYAIAQRVKANEGSLH
jgi:hypothetical protein